MVLTLESDFERIVACLFDEAICSTYRRTLSRWASLGGGARGAAPPADELTPSEKFASRLTQSQGPKGSPLRVAWQRSSQA